MNGEKNNLQSTYETVGKDFDIGSYPEFVARMSSPANRESIYNTLSNKWDMGTFEEFEGKIAPYLQIEEPTLESPLGTPEKQEIITEAPYGLPALGEEPEIEHEVPTEEAEEETYVPLKTPVTPEDEYNESLRRIRESSARISREFKPAVPPAVSAPAASTGVEIEAPEHGGSGFSYAPTALGKVKEFATRPLAEKAYKLIQKPTKDEVEKFFDIPDPNLMFMKYFPEPIKRGIYGGIRAAGETIIGMTSPLNIALLGGAGFLTGIGSKIASAIFSTTMARNMPDEVIGIVDAIKTGDPEEIANKIAHLGITSAFVYGAGKHAIKEVKPSAKKIKEAEKAVEEIKSIIEPEITPKIKDEIKPEVSPEVPKVPIIEQKLLDKVDNINSIPRGRIGKKNLEYIRDSKKLAMEHGYLLKFENRKATLLKGDKIIRRMREPSIGKKAEGAILLKDIPIETRGKIQKIIDELGSELDIADLSKEQIRSAIKDIKIDKGKEASIRAQKVINEILDSIEEGSVPVITNYGITGAKRERIEIPIEEITKKEHEEYLPKPEEALEKRKPPVERVTDQVEEGAVVKLTRIIKEAKPARKETELLKHEELQKRVAVASRMLEKGKGEEAFKKSTAALKGQLPKAEFEPPRNILTERDVFDLFEQIRLTDKTYFKDWYFRKLNTSEALKKVLSGKIPQRKEIELLERMFGEEITGAILSKRSLGAKAWENIIDAANLPRALLASTDLSASLRQGIILSVRHPILFKKAFAAQIRALVSEKSARDIDEIIRTRKYHQLGENSGLDLTARVGRGAKLTAREEMFMSRFAQKIPLVKWSERAYVTFLNKLRADYFDSVARSWEGTGKTVKDYKDLARFVNNATGRGSLGALKEQGAILNATFFSPRFFMSRIKLPLDLFTSTPAVRKIVAKELTAFVGTGIGVLSLLSLHPDVDVEIDPRSSDFGKGRIGDTSIDFWAGYAPISRFVAQVITNERKTVGRGKIIGLNRAETVGRFIQTKLAPTPGLIVDVMRGETFLGEEVSLEPGSVKRQAYQRLTPIFIQDVADAIRFQGLDGATLAIPGVLGIGIQTYPESPWTEISNYKDEIAKETYGEKWDEIGPNAQKSLTRFHDEIAEMELKAKAERTTMPQVDRIIKEQVEAGERVQSKLSENIRKEMENLYISVGGLSRRIGDWYLNDERYKKYQEIIARRINLKMPEMISGEAAPHWAKLSETRKRKMIKNCIDKAKDWARSEIKREVNRKIRKKTSER